MTTESLPAPAIGSVWMHRDGDVYRVEEIGNAEGTKPYYPPTVWYRNVVNGKPYNRKVDDWHRSMTHLGDAEKDIIGTLAGALILAKTTAKLWEDKATHLQAKVSVLENLYPADLDERIARGALSTLWRALGVKDQTAACERIRRLTEDEL